MDNLLIPSDTFESFPGAMKMVKLPDLKKSRIAAFDLQSGICIPRNQPSPFQELPPGAF